MFGLESRWLFFWVGILVLTLVFFAYLCCRLMYLCIIFVLRRLCHLVAYYFYHTYNFFNKFVSLIGGKLLSSFLLLSLTLIYLQISESMDVRTRKGLLNALSGKVGKRMDTLLVPLELLSCISKTEFSDRKAFLRWQKRQVSFFFLFTCSLFIYKFYDELLIGHV